MRIFSESMLIDQSVQTAHGKGCEQKRLEIERCEKNEYLAHEHRESCEFAGHSLSRWDAF